MVSVISKDRRVWQCGESGLGKPSQDMVDIVEGRKGLASLPVIDGSMDL